MPKPSTGTANANTAAGGGDDAYFMTQMTAWIKANATGPAIFWNYGGGTLPLDIPGYTNGDTSAATAVFKSALPSGATQFHFGLPASAASSLMALMAACICS